MSYQMFFEFSAGLNKTLIIPKGSKKEMFDHIAEVERLLKIKRTKFLNNPEHWEHNNFKDIPDKDLCRIASTHNWWVMRFYAILEKASAEPAKGGEKLTSKEFAKMLPGLSRIRVEPERWSDDYYTERMEHLYEVMRRGENEGVSFDAKPLSIDQAKNVIVLFSEFLDKHDVRLDVPKFQDQLRRGDTRDYEWCEKCGAITYNDSLDCKKRKCPLKVDRKEDE